jgi:hypothetical protein
MRLVFGLAGVVIALAAPVEAQVMRIGCGRSDAIDGALRHRFGESPVARGVTDGASPSIMVVYVGPDGSWTLVLVRANGESCIVASGQDWHLVPSGIDG